jgi:hypothetical protein
MMGRTLPPYTLKRGFLQRTCCLGKHLLQAVLGFGVTGGGPAGGLFAGRAVCRGEAAGGKRGKGWGERAGRCAQVCYGGVATTQSLLPLMVVLVVVVVRV